MLLSILWYAGKTPTTRNYLVPHISSPEAENHWPKKWQFGKNKLGTQMTDKLINARLNNPIQKWAHNLAIHRRRKSVDNKLVRRWSASQEAESRKCESKLRWLITIHSSACPHLLPEIKWEVTHQVSQSLGKGCAQMLRSNSNFRNRCYTD